MSANAEACAETGVDHPFLIELLAVGTSSANECFEARASDFEGG